MLSPFAPTAYSLLRGKQQLWSVERPYLLDQVAVLDTGVVVGVGGSLLRNAERPKEIDSWCHVVVLGVDGGELLNHGHCQTEGWLARRSHPYIQQLMVDAENDRFIVRVLENADCDFSGCSECAYERGVQEFWWTYQLSTAKFVERFNFSDRFVHGRSGECLIDMVPVAGTSLLLLHWYRADAAGVQDAKFTISSLNGDVVWSFELPGDYRQVQIALLDVGDFFRKNPAIIRAGRRAEFHIRRFESNQRIVFALEGDGTGKWRVSKLGEFDYAERWIPPGRD